MNPNLKRRLGLIDQRKQDEPIERLPPGMSLEEASAAYAATLAPGYQQPPDQSGSARPIMVDMSIKEAAEAYADFLTFEPKRPGNGRQI